MPWLRMSIVCAGTVAALAFFAEQRQLSHSTEPASVPLAPLLAPPPSWRPVAEPVPLYALEGIDSASFAWEVRSHVSGAREDTLTFGSLGDEGYGRLQLTAGAAEPEPASFYVDLVRQAAQAGLSVVRSAQAAAATTKFGPAEIGAVTLAGAQEESCLALRAKDPALGFAVRAWICGSAAQPATEAQLACLVDRLVLLGTEDPGLKELFAGAERRRTLGCAPAQPRWASVGQLQQHLVEPEATERAGQPRRSGRISRARRP